ncbi:hypothetical protein BDV26DRAFT_263780 [Aspergillus bertholletiae]|uniref:Uncharacterized protein n=1 Tax=Aspergillus bertholletiae TaxID=1226010 RepID=A0A5N7B5C7_9EURO|nr:hypothetical protein BDV26DRAFT_263780 [Aspergillus bertholletiae]
MWRSAGLRGFEAAFLVNWMMLMQLMNTTIILFRNAFSITINHHSYTDTACGIRSPSYSLASRSSVRSIPFRAGNRIPKRARRRLPMGWFLLFGEGRWGIQMHVAGPPDCQSFSFLDLFFSF